MGEEQQQARQSTGRESARWTRVAQATARDTRAIAQTAQIPVRCSAQTARCAARALPVICSPELEGGGCGAGAQFSRDRDKSFPTRYEQAAQWEGYRLLGLREAANQQADAAEGRFAHLAAALTMLGGGRLPLRLLADAAGARAPRAVLQRGDGLRAGRPRLGRLPRAARERAPARRRRRSPLRTARWRCTTADYGPAVTHLQRAVAEWPKAVTAYADLGQAQFLKNEGELSGVTSVPGKRSLEAAIADDSKAIENGSESPMVSSDKGGSLLFLGLLMHDDGQVRDARALSADAAERFEEQRREGRHPGVYLISARFSIAEADLALGAPHARPEYCEAIRTMVELRREVDVEGVIVPAAHTDLLAIVHAHPRLAHAAAQIERQVDLAAAGRMSYGCAEQPRR